MILPRAADGFEWRDFEGGPGLVCRPLAAVASHVFTMSRWPTGRPGRSAEATEPWAPVARAVGVHPSALARIRQVHGVVAVCGTRADSSSSVSPPPLPEGDIVVVGDAGVAGAIQVADCVPLLLADRTRGVVAAAHAGWRGLAARGPRAALNALTQRFGTEPSSVVAALGPSIGACCYEVGPDVRERFIASGFDETTLGRWFVDRPVAIEGNPPLPRVTQASRRPDRWFFDGWASARDQLLDAGVPAGQVFAAGLCTASHPDVFCSYRRDGSPSGRIAAAIACGWRRP